MIRITMHDGSIKEIEEGSELHLSTLRHSCSHVLAQAVKNLYPDAHLAIGPSIADGFYYDIDFTTVYIPNTENDTITYVTAAEKLEHNEKTLRSDLNGETFNYKLTEEELSVWKDKEACAFVNRKTVYGDVNSCIVKLYNDKNNALISVDVNASKFLKDFLIRSLVIFLI